VSTPLGDPLAALFLPGNRGPGIPTRYRSGRLVTWNRSTGANTVRIDGQIFTNLPIIPGTYLAVIVPGDTLSLVSTTDEAGLSTYAIVGASITPPDERLALASGLLGYARYFVDANILSASTTSGTYVAMDSTVPTIFSKVAATTKLEFDMCGTCYSHAATSGIAFGVIIDGGGVIGITRLAEANTLLSAHVTWGGGNILEGVAAGEHTMQPAWARLSGTGTPRVDANDQLCLTVREVLA
jgi:hypothetical protein